jgi:hypothetical protein
VKPPENFASKQKKCESLMFRRIVEEDVFERWEIDVLGRCIVFGRRGAAFSVFTATI